MTVSFSSGMLSPVIGTSKVRVFVDGKNCSVPETGVKSMFGVAVPVSVVAKLTVLFPLSVPRVTVNWRTLLSPAFPSTTETLLIVNPLDWA
jgi:hypothetical protein